MNISFATTARLFAFDASKTVAPKDALPNSAPIRFGCGRQVHLASGTDAGHIRLGLPNRSEKGKRLAGVCLRRLGTRATRSNQI